MECSLDQEFEEAPVRVVGVDASRLQRPLGTTVWATASGRRVRHVIYSLIGCPPVQAAIYILVRHSVDGGREVLAVRATRSAFASVNLARIRRAGARWGANEVHLFRGAKSDKERRAIVSDLCRALRVRPPHRASIKRAARKSVLRAAARRR